MMALLCAVSSRLQAQYGTEVISNPAAPLYVYLGSLPESSAGNLHKLKVDILGGAWESFSTGETIFFISNRNSLKIDQVTTGSTSAGRYTLHAYTNTANGIDFYLLTNNWTAIAVRSCMLGGNAAVLIPNTTSAALPAGTEISPLTINPVQVTDEYGNIGINTFGPDPAYKFSVNGSIRAKEVKVETGWSDYVFGQGYELMPLSALDNYVKANRHLPDVPTAADVEKNGVRLGETEALLLKKIEELTLYILAQDRRIQKLENKP